MEAIRNALLPRRLTQMYADTKRSYEQIVQTNCNFINPQLSSLFLKLKIQKDRLFAWGLEWRDSGAVNQPVDIDGSLDRAGISDLVASIMSSIGQLLDEAEQMQPHRPREFPGTFPDDKISESPRRDISWTTKDVTRLADIVKDLTTSIDTLCDLSRSQRQLSHRPDPQLAYQSFSKSPAAGSEKGHQIHSSSEKSAYKTHSLSSFPESSPLIVSSRIHPHQLRIPGTATAPRTSPRTSPPSYESVAAGAEDRVFAYLTVSTSVGSAAKPSRDESWEKLVLLDYGAIQDMDLAHRDPISVSRFETLMNALRYTPEGAGSCYSVPLGWFEDPKRSRYAFVYQVPTPSISRILEPNQMATPHTLLSFLQHAADSDSSNMPSLEDRFRLAFNLASTVLHLHAKGLTHRNINSNNIFFIIHSISSKPDGGKLWKTGVIRRPCLTSFDQCDEDLINPHQEPLISSIYRHPRVERGQRTIYRPAHDIYSLGLILLEIGLWMPISSLWKTKYARMDFKLRLQTIYIKKLAAKCGSSYMRVVDYCLRAADGNTQAHGYTQQDPTGSHRPPMQQMEFYWKAIRKLEHCCSVEDLDEQDSRCSRSGAVGETESIPAQVSSKNTEVEPQAPTSPPEVKPQVSSSSEVIEDARPHRQAKRKMKIWSHELPVPCVIHWSATMLPELERILKRIIDKWESYSIDLFMVGETADSARPTIYMMCSSVEKVRKALQYVNKEKRLFDIKVVKGEISRSKAGKKKRRVKKSNKREGTCGVDESRDTYEKLNPCYQKKPACGASIGAYMNNQHLPPVSFGGTVLVDGEPFGMSVHHMIENDEADFGLDDTVNLHRSMADDCDESDSSDTGDEGIADCDTCLPNLTEALYPFEISEDEEDNYSTLEDDDDSWLFDDPQSESELNRLSIGDEDMNMGDTIGVVPGQGLELIVTQPAIDDVDCNFFANEDDMDDDHLSSHSLGYIHASSGLRRFTQHGLSHEVDWALIKVKENRLRERNVVNGGARHCDLKPFPDATGVQLSNGQPVDLSASYPCDVVKADELGGLRVHALGRTSGLQTGTILPTMSLIKMPGRVSSSRSWQVMGNFGGKNSSLPFLVKRPFFKIPERPTKIYPSSQFLPSNMADILSVGGDSGAWVVDNASGRVCAHVLAWSARNNTAYIAPMEILLNDMIHVLGADVTLPGSQRSESTTTRKEAPKASTLHHRIVEPNPNSPPSLNFPASQFQHQEHQPRLQRPSGLESTHTSSLTAHNSDVNSDSNPNSPNASPFKSYQPHRNPYPTPSPSPPMATSPPCHPLIDNIILQQPSSSNTDPLCQLETTNTTGVASRSQIIGRGGGGGGKSRGRGRGLEVDGMRAGGGVETRG